MQTRIAPAQKSWLIRRPKTMIQRGSTQLMTYKKTTSLVLLSFLLTIAALPATAGDSNSSPVPAPPKTTVNEVKELIQGTEIVDPYRWLEDQNSPDTRAWIDAQNAYTDSLISKIAGRDALKQQLTALIKIDTMSAPGVRNGRYFIYKRAADQDQSAIYVRKGIDGKD